VIEHQKEDCPDNRYQDAADIEFPTLSAVQNVKHFATSRAKGATTLNPAIVLAGQHRVRRQHQRSFNVFTRASCCLQKAPEDPLQRIFHEQRAIDTRGVLNVPSPSHFLPYVFRTIQIDTQLTH
jgi:hypothetical protein